MTRRYQPTAAQQAESEARRTELLGQLADGIDKLTESDEWQRYLDVQAKLHQYSFNNTLLILCQMPDASQVASFKKWQEMGRHVTKGEHALRVFAPSTRKVEVEVDGQKDERQMLTGFRLVPVFDVSQTEGEPLPEPVHLLEGEDCDGMFGKLSKVAEAVGFSVQVTPEIEGHAGANGLCEYGPKLITVAGNRSGQQQVKSLAHEIGHALLHTPNPDGTREVSRSTCELEAESTAYMTCQQLGIKTDDYSFGYVAGWKGGKAEEVREAIKASGARIKQASKTILDGLEAQKQPELAAEAEREPQKSAKLVAEPEAVQDYEPEMEMA